MSVSPGDTISFRVTCCNWTSTLQVTVVRQVLATYNNPTGYTLVDRFWSTNKIFPESERGQSTLGFFSLLKASL